MTEPPQLTTRVAHMGFWENRFRGHRVFAELAGQTSFWSLLSLALGGQKLSPQDEQVLDDIAVCSTAADPRVPLLKLVRLMSSYGSTMTALAAGCLPLEGALTGPWTAAPAAEFLLAVRRKLGPEPSRDAIRLALQNHLERGEPVMGFGVVARKADERLVALRRCIERRGRADGLHWRIMCEADRILDGQRKTPANISAGMAAACLDLGFSPAQIGLLGLTFVWSCFVANAFEGAEQAPSILRRIPAAFVTYRGPAPRKSPRALARSQQ